MVSFGCFSCNLSLGKSPDSPKHSTHRPSSVAKSSAEGVGRDRRIKDEDIKQKTESLVKDMAASAPRRNTSEPPECDKINEIAAPGDQGAPLTLDMKIPKGFKI